MERSIGIDIGGSGVRGAVVEDGIMGEIHTLSLDDRRAESVISTVDRIIRELGTSGSIGVCVPGFVQAGVVRESPNFPTWKNLRLSEELSNRLKQPITLMNDANAAALGAWTMRGEREDLVLLALGTGVGGGVVIDGEVLTGAGGTGAELGHIYAGGNRLCGCGARGCLETWCSTTGLCKAAEEQGYRLDSGREIIELADAGEEWAIRICDDAADALGRGLASLINIFNPDTVLLTGGLAKAKHRFEARAQSILTRQGIRPSLERLSLVWGPRAEHFSILGASRQVRREYP